LARLEDPPLVEELKMTLHRLVIIYFVLTMISAVFGAISWRVFAR
jgi:hypothetical protein